MKSIQQRLDSLKEQTLMLSINSRLDELLKSEEACSCQGSECPNNDANSCFGHVGCKGDGSCHSKHAKEFDSTGNEIHTKSMPVNKITCDDGTVIDGYFITSGGY